MPALSARPGRTKLQATAAASQLAEIDRVLIIRSLLSCLHRLDSLALAYFTPLNISPEITPINLKEILNI
jgi:hypothetical protein